MTTYHFSLATPADDAPLRRILRNNAMPGGVTISYEREPSFFAGTGVHGEFCQTLVARHAETDAVTGFVCRATRPLYVNGEAVEVGYLSQLRVDAPYQGRGWVAQGFHALRDLHQDGRVRGYLATITEGNRIAEGILVKHPRPHYPRFAPLGMVDTFALVAHRFAPHPAKGMRVTWATERDLPTLFDFYQRHAAQNNLAPMLTREAYGTEVLRDLRADDMVLVQRGDEIVGMGAFWDQSAYKQSVVRGYQGVLQRGRPWLNGLAALIGNRGLPSVGAAIPFGYGSFITTAHQDPAIYRTLVEALRYRAWQRGKTFLMVGLVEGNPYRAVLQRMLHILYRSTLYWATWTQETAPVSPLHIEIATL